jgi:hypothetical protein
MRALGRELAKYLLDRKVKTDIAQGPLKAWLEASERPQALPSVFASMAPSESMSDRPPTLHPAQAADVDGLLELLREPAPPTKLSIDHARGQDPARAARGATTVGRQRSLPSPKPKAPLAQVPKWVWFAGPAALAFVLSLIVSLARTPARSTAHPAATAAAAPVGLAPRTKPLAAPPSQTPAPSAESTPEAVARLAAPDPTEASSRGSAPSRAPKVIRPVTARPAPAARPAARKPASRGELKNPFAH